MDKYIGLNYAKVSSQLKTYDIVASKKSDNISKRDNIKSDHNKAKRQKSGFGLAVSRWLCAIAVLAVVYFGAASEISGLKKASDFIRDQLSRKSLISISYYNR